MDNVDLSIIQNSDEAVVPVYANDYFPIDIEPMTPSKPLRRFPHSEYLQKVLENQQSRSKFSVYKHAHEIGDSQMKNSVDRTFRKVVSLTNEDSGFNTSRTLNSKHGQ